MTAPVWLIAEREFRTYVATISFWAALAIGPLAAGGMLLVSMGHDTRAAVTIRAANTELAQSAAAALREAGRLDGRQYSFTGDGARLVVSQPAADRLDLHFDARFPLSETGRVLLARTLERDAARRWAGIVPLSVHVRSTGAPHGPDAGAVSRFFLMMMLWLTLTGSLGMLLQTVARERANRALEGLLAAARPWEIVAGKLAGVGAISLLVLSAWLGSVVGLSGVLSAETGLSHAILSYVADPATLLSAAVIYLLAYAFYGSVTVALGAQARDVAAAQNLSRPMFVLLLAAFFIALISVSTASEASPWLMYLPPFTPFLLLLSPSGAIAPGTQALLLGVLLLASLLIAAFAAARLSYSTDATQLFGRRRA
jgi:ABC-2 type transport system permease protein